ncbi:MAG: copper transport protein [Gaiellaceae bacterium]|nr:copper transport protein [Gaiellaceae bacterium]
MKRAAVVGLATAAALALPAAALAHAALLRTTPSASVTVNAPPEQVALVYSEAVEPRFAIVSVTDAGAQPQTVGPPHRSAANPDELDVPLKHLRRGWYLVVWRVISVDGHPVRGAFTFAVGPNAGPAPQFKIPSLSETAATPTLVTARWIVFLSLMTAIGLFVLRVTVVRPLRGPPRALSAAFWSATAVALVAVPIYALLATSKFALRSFWSLGALIPLLRTSAFGRGYLDLELLLALFAVAAGIALWVDRPDRDRRSVAELLALCGAALAGGAVLLAPGAAGHAAQTAPRSLALLLDWLHLVAGSLWIGGLIGLLVLWRSLPAARRLAGLAVCVPRFSNVALGSVILLFGSGVGASILHLPTLASLWQTSYGQAIIVKASLLLCAIAVASGNLLRTVPALSASEPPMSAAVLLRRLVSVEVLLVAAAIAVAAVLSSLPPPSKALASIGGASARTGPGPVTRVVDKNGYRLEFHVLPNRAAVTNQFAVRIERGGSPLRGADVTATVTMLDMEMPAQSYKLSEVSPGLYEHSAPALVMVGHWGLSFAIAPPGATPFTVLLVDRANG